MAWYLVKHNENFNFPAFYIELLEIYLHLTTFLYRIVRNYLYVLLSITSNIGTGIAQWYSAELQTG
jgi:hypothetical protein